jgi:hypothetical protein
VTPNVRTYLARNLKAGTVRSLSVAVALDGENLARANAGQAIADDTVKAAFAIDGAELLVAEGLPPLAKTAVTGVVTGTRADLKAPSGEVRTGDGRALVLSDGSFTLPDIWADRGIARVGFRMEGGADALASFLQTPLLKGVSNLDVDPATLKGRADLKVAIPLPINDMPKFEDLAIGVQGAIQDLAVDRAFGKERFEGGLLTVAYDRGSLAIKGEGRLAGSPATIDLRQPKGAPGEAVVQLTLDDAARARKGLGFGSQLTGPLPLKVTLPLGRNAKAGTRVEADLARVGVDGLIPGWTKAVGRPGRLAFTMVDDKAGDRGTELKDLSLDSGPAHLRGQAMVSAEGHLEKAELSAFKLSPGDDMRVVLDRTANGYRVQVRGNVADARPFVKNLGGSAAPARPARGEPRPEPRGDLDLISP